MFRNELSRLEKLDEEVMFFVLCHLSLRDTLTMRLVCTMFSNLPQRDNVWHHALQADFGIDASHTRKNNEAFFDIYKKQYIACQQKFILVLSQDKKHITIKLDKPNLNFKDATMELMDLPDLGAVIARTAHVHSRLLPVDDERDNIPPLLMRAKNCRDYDSVLSLLEAIKSHPNSRLYVRHFVYDNVVVLNFPKNQSIDCSKTMTLDNMIDAVREAKNKAMEAENQKRCTIS